MIRMPVEIDHAFICTARGAPAVERLRELGLTEGPPNTHPGQGTACRRFFFDNAMLELLWVEHEEEARQAQRLRLWERWSGRDASPFGIIVRGFGACPFNAWDYSPDTMPDLHLQIAANTGLDEPMWCYTTARPSRQPVDHPAGFHALTGVRLHCPAAGSVTAAMAQSGLITLHTGVPHVLELQFDGGRSNRRQDLRPDLPLILTW